MLGLVTRFFSWVGSTSNKSSSTLWRRRAEGTVELEPFTISRQEDLTERRCPRSEEDTHHKQNYRRWNSRPPVKPAHIGVAAGPGGIVPLPAAGWREKVSGGGFQPTTEHTESVKYYCLAWVDRYQSRSLKSARPEQVCAVKVSSEEVVVLVDTRRPSLESDKDSPNAANAEEAVTLASVGEPGDLVSFALNATSWEGPKIFAMALDAEGLAAAREMEILRDFEDARGGVLVVVLLRPPPNPDMPKRVAAFPRKALMNLVSDVCTSRYLLSLPAYSRLSPDTFKVVTSYLRSKQSASSSGGSGDQNQTPEITGPVTLVVPFDTADEAVLFPDSDAAASAAATSASRNGGNDYSSGSGSLRTGGGGGGGWGREGARTSGDNIDSALLAADGKESIAVAAAALRQVARTPPHISFLALPYGGTAKDLAATAGGSDGGGDGGVDSGTTSTTTVGGVWTEVSRNNGNHRDLITRQERHLAVPPGGSGKTRRAGWTAWPRWMRWVGWRGWGRDDGHAAAAASKSGARTPGSLKSTGTRSVRRYAYLFEGSGTGRRGANGGAERGSEHDAAAAFEGPAEAKRALDLIFSGPRMPGLVVDLWSPGSIFLRHVEEFGDLGCMDAAYALGLWRAGSSFEVVESTLSTTALSSAPSAQQNDAYGEHWKTLFKEGEANGLHVPGGVCLRREAVASTASIYSAFLLQVANVYRHPWSGIAGRQDKFNYQDHWDHFHHEGESSEKS
ncbi:unnamed protein product [Pylaiella littoralis]